MNFYRHYRIFGIFCFVFFVCLLVGFNQIVGTAAAGSLSPQEAVSRAWELAQASGFYSYRSHIEQTTYPVPAVVNAGRPPVVDNLGFAGSVDFDEQRLEMTFWQDGSFDPQRGLELRVEDGRSYARLGQDEWQEVDNLSEMFAPTGDPLSFLAAASNIQRGESRAYDFGVEGEAAAGRAETEIEYSQYTFDLNGPAFAEYVRGQMEHYLRQRGELPNGLSLSASDAYRNMTGMGDLWLDEDGLPSRLSLGFEMTLASGEQVKAHLVNDYSGFDRERVAQVQAEASLPPHLRLMLQMARPQTGRAVVIVLAGLVLMTAASLIVIRYWHSPRLYTAVVSVVIFSILAGPLFQSQEVAAFYETQRERAQEQEARRAEAEEMQAAEESLSSSWDPHQNPLKPGSHLSKPASAEARAAAMDMVAANTGLEAADSDGDGLSDADEEYWWSCAYPVGTAEYNNSDFCEGVTDPADSDGDGLADLVEVSQLATLPDLADSDGDTIPDNLEIQGFAYNGQSWHLDPLEADTNRDGRPDGAECPVWSKAFGQYDLAAICPDTDGDGNPDLFDEDDDEDGIDDADDMLPEAAFTTDTFGYADPFELEIDNLETGHPVRLALQMRPIDAGNLNLNGHILDWPAGDTKGQIQRRLETTFADTDNLALRSAAVNASAGDIRLVPMLEILMPYSEGHYANLPVKPAYQGLDRSLAITASTWISQTELEPYAITVQEADTTPGDLVAYLPLNSVASRTGDEVVAFEANMLYWPMQGTTADPALAEWGTAHEFRLVWLVQMLTDECIDPAADPEICARQDRLRVVHVYYDEWQITGLSVNEEHGLDLAIVYEDPAQDPDLSVDEDLWVVSWNLNNTFLRGRDCDSFTGQSCNSNGSRDVTVSNLDSAIDGWSGGSDYLVVQNGLSYPHQDYLAYALMTQNSAILDTEFAAYADQTTPTLLFVQEIRSRALAFEAATTLNNGRLTLDFADIPLLTNGFMKWNTYQQVNGTWENIDLTSHLTYLDWVLKQQPYFLPADDSLDSQDVAEGKRIWAQMYYYALYQGLAMWLEIDGTLLWEQETALPESSMNGFWYLVAETKPAATGFGKIAGAYLGQALKNANFALFTPGTWLNVFRDYKRAFSFNTTNPAKTASNYFVSVKNKRLRAILGRGAADGLTPLTRGTFAIAVLGLAVVASGYILQETGQTKVGKAVVIAGYAILTIPLLLLETARAISLYQRMAAAGQKIVFGWAKAATSALRASLKSMAIAGAVGLVIELLITWGFFIYVGITKGFAFGQIQFQRFLIYTIAASIVGAVLAAIALIVPIGTIIVLLISLVDLIVMLFGHKGPSQWVTEAIVYLFYDVDKIVRNFDSAERLDMAVEQMELAAPDLGFILGNTIHYTIGVTNTIRYNNDVNVSDARESTFVYALQADETPLHDDLDIGQMKSAWEALSGPELRLSETVSAAVPLNNVGTGLNANLGGELYLSEGFVLPYRGCYVVLRIDIDECTINVAAIDTLHFDLGSYEVYDILPNTIGEFATLDWNSVSNPMQFPPQADMDADGLLNTAAGGGDTDDSDSDQDRDGLTDLYEINYGLDVDNADPDGDGLSDHLELRYMTNPFAHDSDGDGLNDYIEAVEGWLVAYDDNGAVATTRVWSNPNNADSDEDTLTDLEEFVFGQHPYIETDPSIIKDIVRINSFAVAEETGYVFFGQFEETAGGELFLDSSGNDNTAICDRAADTCPTAAVDGRYGSALLFGTNDSLNLNTTAPTDFNTSDFTVAMWVKTTNSNVVLFSKSDGNPGWRTGEKHFYINNSGAPRFAGWGNGFVSSNQVVNDGNWHHIAFTWDYEEGTTEGTGTIYVDGVADSTDNYDATDADNPNDMLWIGRLSIFLNNDFNGTLDEIVVLDKAAGATEIADLYNGRYNFNDLVVVPDTTLTYRATVTNTSPTQPVNGLLTAESQITNPAMARPVAALRMEAEDIITSLVNSTGENNTATCLGDSTCPTFSVPGQYGYGTDFDGQDDTLHMPPLADAGANGTVFAFWLDTGALPAAGEVAYILDTAATISGATDITLNSNGDLILDLAGYGLIVGDTNLVAGSGWQHILIANPTNSVRVYKNYSSVTWHIDSNLPPLSLGPGTLGNDLSQTQPFDGRLDEFVFYSTGFSDNTSQPGFKRYQQIMQGNYDLTEDSDHLPAFLLKFEEEINIDLTRFANAGSLSDLVCDSTGTCPALTTNGPFNEYVQFDGLDDYIPVNQVLPFGENLYVEFWLQVDALPATGARSYILDSDRPPARDMDIYINSNGRLVMAIYNYDGSLHGAHTSNFSFGGANLGQGFLVRLEFADNRHYSNGQDGYFYTLKIDGNIDVPKTNLNLGGNFGDGQIPFGPGRLGRGIDGSSPFTGALDELYAGSPASVGYDVSFDSDLNLNVGVINRANEGKAGSCAFTQLACPTVTAGGRFGEALTFDGTDYLTLDDLDFAQGDYTVATWFRTSTTGGRQDIFSAVQSDTGSHGVLLELTNSGSLRYLHRFPTGTSGGVDLISPATYTDGQWHYATAVRQNDNLFLYVDGVLVGQTAGGGSATDNMAVILGSLNGSSRHFSGELDELLIIPSAVDAQGVQLLMNTVYPILGVNEAFVPFTAAAMDSVEISGSATVNETARTSVHQFEETVEAALELQTPIVLSATDDNAADLELYMPFEDVPGSTVFDNVVDIYDGFCSGSSCPTAGLRGVSDRALYFDGVDDVITTERNMHGRSVAVWVKADRGTIVDFNNGDGYLDTNGYGVLVDRPFQNGKWWFHVPIDIPENVWTHVVAVFDPDTAVASVYVNGEFHNSVQTNYDSGLQVRLYQPTIGRNANGLDPLHGYLDDLRLYLTTLTAADIQKLYAQSAPLMHFAFDEEEEATAFVDSSPNSYVGLPKSTVAFNPTLSQTVTTYSPIPGTDGQIGNTALFNGDGYISIETGTNVGDLTNEFTLMGWINPDDIGPLQRIFSSGRANSNGGIGFGLYAGNFIFTTYGIKDYFGIAPLEEGIWQHVAVVLDDNNSARFYLDGQLVDTVTGPAPAIPNPDDPFYIGANHETDGTFNQFYSGELDELAFYGRAMLDTEIESIYLRQLRWYQDRAVFAVTVDTDNPTIELVTTAQYRPNSYQMLVANTADPTSEVVLLDFGLKAPGDSSFTWQSAANCQVAGGTISPAAWCPAFDPSQLGGEGEYRVKFRAVDVVGNETTSGETVFYVDGTPPTAATSYSDTPLNIPADPTAELAWRIPLNGTLADPNLSSGQPGSGVDSSSVQIAMVDSRGTVLGGIAQAAQVSGNTWSLTYTTTGPRPEGRYTVAVTLADNLGNQTTVNAGTIVLDERPPQAHLNLWETPAHVISDTVTLAGTAADGARWGDELAGYSFETAGPTFYDRGPEALHATCSDCPAAISGVFGQGLDFNGTSNRVSLPFLFDPAATSFTVAVWFKANDTITGKTLIQQEDGTIGTGRTWLKAEGSKLLTFLGGSDLQGAPNMITASTWHHAAVTYDGTTLRLYLDGALVASDERLLEPGDGPIRLGMHKTNGNIPHYGQLDELFFFDRALTAEELYALAQSQGAGVQTVEVAFDPINFEGLPTLSTWRPATLVNGRWTLDLPANLQNFYEIRLRSSDNYGNEGRESTVWRGFIDNKAPFVAASGKYIGGANAAETEYTFSFSDFALDPASFQQPCSAGAIVTLAYDGPDLPYDGQIFEVSATCRLEGHETSRDFTACDAVGHCTTINVTPGTGGGGNILITAPAQGSVISTTQPVLIQGGASAPDGIEQIAVTADGIPVDTLTMGGVITNSAWTVDWFPAAPGTYMLTAVMTDSLNHSYSDTVDVTLTGYVLDVTLGGTGSGTVTSDLPGIVCGLACNATYAPDTIVTLTAAPGAGSAFNGWGGACSGSGMCQVTMDRMQSVTAEFALTGIIVQPTMMTLTETGVISQVLTISLAAPPTNVVSINLASSDAAECEVFSDELLLDQFNWQSGTTTLVTSVDDDLDDGDQSCTIITSAATSADPNYHQMAVDDVVVTVIDDDVSFVLDVTKSGPGSGTVTSDLPGINCGSDCTEAYVEDSVVTLTATPAAGSAFNGWSGACSGSGMCQVTMDQMQSVTAEFSPTGIIVQPTNITLTETGIISQVLAISLAAPPTNVVSINLASSDPAECEVFSDELLLDQFNWQAGTTTLITSVDDNIDDGDQTCTIVTSAAVSADPNYHGMEVDDVMVTVIDDDGMPTINFSASSYAAVESGTVVTATISLSNPSAESIEVTVGSQDGTATAGLDYIAVVAEPITFAPLQTSAAVVIRLLDDVLDEPTETLTLTLTAPQPDLLGLNRQAIVEILDNDAPPLIRMLDSSALETDGLNTLAFTVELLAPSAKMVTAAYETADGTAVAGTHYTATTGMLTFAPGETRQTIIVPIMGDETNNEDRTLQLILSQPINAVIGDNDATGTIVDDDLVYLFLPLFR